MSRYMTSSTLIDSVVARAMLPVSQVTFKTADFLRFATEEMDMGIIPFVLQYHEDYFLTSVDIPLEDGKNKYTIPYRAIGNKLRDVGFLDNDAIFEMTRVTVDDIAFYQYGGGNAFTSTGFRVFYIQNNEIVLLPEKISNPTGSLRVAFYVRPNQLVEESRVATITSVNLATGEVGVNSVPANITLGVNLDIMQTRSPHKILVYDKVATNIDTINKIITFDIADLPSNLAVGDQISLAEESCIPQIPTDLHSMLAQRVACRCLEALGDQAGLQAANAKLAEMEQKGATLIDDRVEGAPLKVNNRHSFLNRTKSSFRR